jgi:hypothetical protein
MKSIAMNHLASLAGLTFSLLISVSGTLHADDQHNGARGKTAVSGNFDWTIVPPNLGPHIIPGTDGDLHLRHLPLVGKFTLNGKGVVLEAKIHVDLNGELDPTGTGVVWGPGTITATIDGVKTIVFEGQGTANEVNLVAVGKMSLSGRGPYEGSNLELTFEEIGPGDSNTYTFTGCLIAAPRH